ncbi:sepiapterin reductase [Achlya hypogyna]|uniref:Sepiapterin reductase n=1 Tax=Achlya hypogyna TaxID=1202772 RepID=A0A1V9YGZ4_ACHHY|nr:sepiapterin reductase [Achlya hypogyna]
MKVVLITGASRGFGRALALAFAQKRALLADNLVHIHLWSRDAAGLAETARLVAAECHGDTATVVEVTTTQVDFGARDDYVAKIDGFLAATEVLAPSQVVLVHNAGSLGEIGLAQDLSSVAMMQEHMEVNVSSVMWFNKRFLDVFGTRTTMAAGPGHVIVNVSSLNAIEPFATCNTYCVIKAARDMHHRVIAVEQGSTVKTLNYAPGPMDTDMQLALRESNRTDATLKSMFQQLKTSNTYVDTLVSATLCVQHIFGPTFVSGSHIDYYDICAA